MSEPPWKLKLLRFSEPRRGPLLSSEECLRLDESGGADLPGSGPLFAGAVPWAALGLRGCRVLLEDIGS